MKLKLLATLAIYLFLAIGGAFKAYASKERGGGVVFVCQEDRLIGHRTRVYLADSWPIKEASILYDDLKKITFTDINAALQQAVDRMSDNDEELGEALRLALSEITIVEKSPLPLLGDDGITDIPDHCEKRQVGIQTFVTGIVEVDMELDSKMSHVDQLLFRLHEGYLRVVWKAGVDPNMQHIRNKILDTATNPSFLVFLEYTKEKSGACLLPEMTIQSHFSCGRFTQSKCENICVWNLDFQQKICGRFIGGPCGGI